MRNIAWVGRYTFGASFGSTIVFSESNFNGEIESLHLPTQEAFDAFWVRHMDVCRFVGAEACRDHCQTTTCEDCYREHPPSTELLKVLELAARYKCTC